MPVGIVPALPAANDQDGGPSNSTIDVYVLTEKWGTVNSLKSAFFIALVYRGRGESLG